MVFSSLSFFIFLVVIFGATYSLPQRFRPAVLLASSYLFYAFWKASYLWVIVFLTAVDYILGPQIERAKGATRKMLWTISIAANLGLLFVFKYLGFFAHEFNRILEWLHAGGAIPVPELILPLGISFHTFQAISYSTDVYRGHFKAEKNLVRFALFIAWFPQMVAGPIERASTLLVQLRNIELPTATQFRSGLFWLIWGLVKKIVVADGMAILVDDVYARPFEYGFAPAWIAFFAYAFQIYCDFSGYTDMAKGSSLLFGVRLTENFNAPYLSRSFIEFWKRWHISLSLWFFEYVFYPLARRWPSQAGIAMAILVTFLASGVWHGANWTFLLWGFANGLIYFAYVSAQRLAPEAYRRFEGPPAIALNFFLVCFCWVLFRAPNIDTASEVYISLMGLSPENMSLPKFLADRDWRSAAMGGLALLIHGVKGAEIKNECERTWGGIFVYIILMLAFLAAFGQFASRGFIYFQF